MIQPPSLPPQPPALPPQPPRSPVLGWVSLGLAVVSLLAGVALAVFAVRGAVAEAADWSVSVFVLAGAAFTLTVIAVATRRGRRPAAIGMILTILGGVLASVPLLVAFYWLFAWLLSFGR